ncbi:MAG: Ig-like domain-containing protein [Leucothrix sp.]
MTHQVNLAPWQRCFCYIALLLLCMTPLSAAQPTAFDNWAKTAKIGGAAIAVGMSQQEIDTILDTLVAQNVTVVEADSDLSNYLTDAQFELELAFMRQFADASHKRGLRVVWYIPALEVITPNGINIPNTMAKDHPDWVQVGLDGQQNVFYGGGGQVFWVEQDAESAWMSPSSTGYRNYFFNRIKQMVDTGIDGIWADVPIYADFGNTKWSGFNAEAITKFESDTGYSKPVAEDWDDPSWKRWIHWRHEELARFLKDLTTLTRDINPEFTVIAETLPTDYNGGTIYGLDAGFLKDVEGLTEVWEIDTMSNSVGMRNARTDDWISFISALKYARAAAGKKPSWTFTYGVDADDAQQVMSQALIAGNNPYELKVPEMATTVGNAYRTRMFNWSKVNAPYLFETESTATTGILFSSSSRDYVDQFEGLGMFATTDGGSDDLWWSESFLDSVYERNYLGEHRGVLKVLVNEHIPFNILVVPDQAELNQYQTIFMPNIQSISDAEAQRLRLYVQQGGHLIVTGPNPTGMNEFGIERTNYALSDLLGFNKGQALPNAKVHSFGAGQTHYFSAQLGKQYLTDNTASARSTLANKVRSLSSVNVTTDADDRVYVETSQLDQQAVLQFTNFIGLDGNFSVSPTTISVTYTVPSGESVNNIQLSNPDNANATTSNVNYSQSGSTITFSIPLTQYALVIVSFNGAQAPSTNHVPSAGDDRFLTDINTALNFSAGQLLSNDGDLDGNSLSIQSLVASSNASGSVSNLGGGNYRYTPTAGFSGVDTLTYTVDDGEGAQDIAQIKIRVAPLNSYYYPNAVTLLVGAEDTDTLTQFVAVDGETYDIIAVDSNSSRVVDWYATTTIQEDVSDIAEIKVSHIGHYSLNDVSQQAYIYNYQAASWEQFDDETVGYEGDYPAVKRITDNIAAYVSPTQQMRLRIRGQRNNGDLNSWTDRLVWEVVPVASTNNSGISNPVGSSTLVVDGSLTDWGNIAALGQDPADISSSQGQADWREGWMAHSSDTLFIAYRNDGVINTASWWAWGVYLDTDSNSNTGYNISGTVGADYMLNGWSLFKYTGNGSNWSWQAISGVVTANAQGDITEMSLARSAIGNPASVNVLFRSDNSAFSSSPVVDYFPDGNGYFEYQLGGSGGGVVTDPVSNTQTMSIDGDLSDWSQLQSFGVDGNDISGANSQADILEGWMAHDTSSLYVAYRNDGNINTSTWWPWQVYLDTDSNPNTGFDAGNGVGADFLLQGAGVYQYIGTGNDWSWQYISYSNHSVNGAIAEIEVPRSAINNPSAIRAIFKARNGIFNGDYSDTGTDNYPNLGSGYLSYVLGGGGFANTVANNALSLDGDLSDWGALQPFSNDANDIGVTGAKADWLQTWMAHDSNNLYLAYQNDGPIDTTTWWPWQIFIDTDADANTGFKASLSLGAKYMIQGAALYEYTGSGSDWSWQYISSATNAAVNNIAELKIPRSAINNESALRIVFKASNWPFTGSYDASGVDYAPDNANSATDGYFTYDASQ